MIRLLFILINFACQSTPTYPWFTGELEEIKQMTGSKLIMMEFYTDT